MASVVVDVESTCRINTFSWMSREISCHHAVRQLSYIPPFCYITQSSSKSDAKEQSAKEHWTHTHTHTINENLWKLYDYHRHESFYSAFYDKIDFTFPPMELFSTFKMFLQSLSRCDERTMNITRPNGKKLKWLDVVTMSQILCHRE